MFQKRCVHQHFSLYNQYSTFHSGVDTYELEENAAADPIVAVRAAIESFMLTICLTLDCEKKIFGGSVQKDVP